MITSESFGVKIFGGDWIEHRHVSRRRALGWPLARSQEEHLSYCIGSPLALGGLEISLVGVCLGRTAFVPSSRLVGESLPG